MKYPEFEATVDGKTWHVDTSDIDGLEWRDIKRATEGMTPQKVFIAAAEGDFEAVGALLWIVRRRDEPKLTYEQVLKSLSFAGLSERDAEEEPDEAPPTEAADGEN